VCRHLGDTIPVGSRSLQSLLSTTHYAATWLNPLYATLHEDLPKGREKTKESQRKVAQQHSPWTPLLLPPPPRGGCSRMGSSCLPTPRKRSHRPRSKYSPHIMRPFDRSITQEPRAPAPPLLHHQRLGSCDRCDRTSSLARLGVASAPHHPLVSSRRKGSTS
jgi:hypothetical protein